MQEYCTENRLSIYSDPPPAPAGQKYDQDKVRYDLITPEEEESWARVLTYGAHKYSGWQWTHGIEYSRLYGALRRHIAAWYAGEELDPESGLPHLAHAMCCLQFLMAMPRLHPELDDRPSKVLPRAPQP